MNELKRLEFREKLYMSCKKKKTQEIVLVNGPVERFLPYLLCFTLVVTRSDKTKLELPVLLLSNLLNDEYTTCPY